MIRPGKAGRFGGLLVWKLDRFARNIRDGEDLLDLGVLIDGPDSGRIDLRTAHGMSTFRKQIEAAPHASNETRKRSGPRSPTCSPAATASAGPGGCSASRYWARPSSTTATG